MNNFRHVGIVTNDMEESCNFYVEKLGFKIINDNKEDSDFINRVLNLRDSNLRTVKLRDNNNFTLELLSFNFEEDFKDVNYKNIFSNGITHIAITVSDLDNTISQIKDDVEFLSEPEVSPDGKVNLVFCRAIDGVFLELVEELVWN